MTPLGGPSSLWLILKFSPDSRPFCSALSQAPWPDIFSFHSEPIIPPNIDIVGTQTFWARTISHICSYRNVFAGFFPFNLRDYSMSQKTNKKKVS